MGVIFILYIIVFTYGPWNVDHGFCEPVEMFKALFCIMFGAMGAGMGAIFAADASKAKLAAHEMFRVLDRASSVDALAPSSRGQRATSLIAEYKGDAGKFLQFIDVDFVYPHRPVPRAVFYMPAHFVYPPPATSAARWFCMPAHY